MSATSVSVVIPTHNRRHTIGRAIESARGQTAPAHEIIVIDDGSTDGTAAWLAARWPDLELLIQDNRGVSAARNLGISAARGEWIALLDSDDHWFPEKLEWQLDAVGAAPGHRLCHTDEIWIRNGRRVNPKRRHRKYGGYIFKHCLPLCAISPSAAMIHKSVFDDIGLFDESLPACEDYDLWLRICSREPVLYLDEHLLVKTGGHDDQLSRRHPAMDQYRIRALLNLLERTQLATDDRLAAVQMLDLKLRVFGDGARKRGNTALLESWLRRRAELEKSGRE